MHVRIISELSNFGGLKMKNDLTGLWEKAASAQSIGFPIVRLEPFFAIFDLVRNKSEDNRVFLINTDIQCSGCLMQVFDWQHGEDILRFHCYTSLPLEEEFRQRDIPWSIWS